MTKQINEAELVEELRSRGYFVERIVSPGDGPLPEKERYRPYANMWATYLPWVGLEEVLGVHRTLEEKGARGLVGGDRMWTLRTLLAQCLHLDGEVWEAGVYQGGTALMLRRELEAAREGRTLRLFDTFEGMPETKDGVDVHREGDFADTSLEFVRSVVGEPDFVRFEKGFIPDTFTGLEQCRIAFAHVDVDIHDSVAACCRFIYPRLAPGGVMVFDDYGIHTCPGAKRAVDEFFADKPESVLCLPTGQAVMHKLP